MERKTKHKGWKKLREIILKGKTKIKAHCILFSLKSVGFEKERNIELISYSLPESPNVLTLESVPVSISKEDLFASLGSGIDNTI